MENICVHLLMLELLKCMHNMKIKKLVAFLFLQVQNIMLLNFMLCNITRFKYYEKNLS